MLGHYFRAFDDKNRILVPAKFRNELGGVCYITLGPDRALEIRSAKEFAEFESALKSLPSLSRDSRAYARMILGNTLDVAFDKQGRVGIPEHFLKLANLPKDVAFVGVGNKIELWSKTAFEKFQKQYEAEGSLDELAEKLHKSGVEL